MLIEAVLRKKIEPIVLHTAGSTEGNSGVFLRVPFKRCLLLISKNSGESQCREKT